jgi:hypothetical protein
LVVDEHRKRKTFVRVFNVGVAADVDLYARLAGYHGEFEYRVRNSYELRECVVRENKLRKAP